MEQAVIIYLRLRGGEFGSPKEGEDVLDLERQLASAIADGSGGELDGDEFGDNQCILYTYGPSADRLFTIVEPILRTSPLASGGYAIKRYGEARDPNSREVRITW